MCSDKFKQFNYKYYAVEILDPQYEELERFICIPASWIRVEESDKRVLVSYPLDEEASVTKQRVKDGKEFLASWTVIVADVKYGADSYEDVINYITIIENRLLQEQSYTEIIQEYESPTSIETNLNESSLNSDLELSTSQEIVTEPTAINIDTFEEQTHAVTIGDAIHENLGNSPQILRDEQDTNRDPVVISNDTNNEMHETSADDNSPMKSAEDIIKLIFETDFLNDFKRNHSSLVERQIKMGKIHHDYINLSSVMKKIIHLVENYKKCYIDQPHSTPEDRNVNVEVAETVEVIVNEKAETKTTQGEQGGHESDEDEIIDNDRKCQTIQQKRFTKKFTLPEEYDENDSRWTLRYRKKTSNLVELTPPSHIYVDATRLQNCKIIAKDGRTFARLLLVEIFSDNALKVCSLTGRIAYTYKSIAKEYTQRPGLDGNARIVLFNYVEQYGKKRNWPSIDNHSLTHSVRNKLKETRAKAHK